MTFQESPMMPALHDDVADRMQRAAESRLTEIDEAAWRLEDNPDDLDAQEVVGLWCGCETCLVREVLTSAVPILIEAIGEHDVEDCWIGCPRPDHLLTGPVPDLWASLLGDRLQIPPQRQRQSDATPASSKGFA